jgi:hypothetical protein
MMDVVKRVDGCCAGHTHQVLCARTMDTCTLSATILLNPKFDKALIERARLSLSQGDTTTAISDFTAYLVLSPDKIN